MTTTSAPGKIHFLGEHTAVYGKPAILAAIDKRVKVDLLPTEDRMVHIISKNFKREMTRSVHEILDITREAQEKWHQFRETDNIAVLNAIKADELFYPAIVIGETLMYYQQNLNEGFHLSIDSDIPIGSGHGSSAAVAVSIASAVSRHICESTKKEDIAKIAIKSEQIKHGNPSYGDVAAVIHGGLIWFRKETPELILVEPLDFTVAKNIAQNVMVIQSGIPEESTGEMVHNVNEFRKSSHDTFTRILEEQESLTRELLAVLQQGDSKRLIAIMKAGERNLEALGVVSHSAKALIRQIEDAGGAAKVCGAGGLAKGSGAILVYHPEKGLQHLANDKNKSYYAVQLGGEGLTIT
jgi:mevalonate kinase